MRTAAIVVDNAHSVDRSTVERLMNIRRLLKHKLALIFCASIESTTTIDERLSQMIAVTFEPDDVASYVELKPLNEHETKGIVLIKILEHLNIDFAQELSVKNIVAMGTMFWSETIGGWLRLRRVNGASKISSGRIEGNVAILPVNCSKR